MLDLRFAKKDTIVFHVEYGLCRVEDVTQDEMVVLDPLEIQGKRLLEGVWLRPNADGVFGLVEGKKLLGEGNLECMFYVGNAHHKGSK